MPKKAFIAAWSPKNGLYQIIPAKIEPAASTPSGISMVLGLSCAWSWAWWSPRGSPKKVRKISRQE